MPVRSFRRITKKVVCSTAPSFVNTSKDFVFAPGSSFVFGPGLLPQPVCAGPLEFYLQTRDKCGNNLTVGGQLINVTIAVESRLGLRIVPNYITYQSNGTYAVTFNPTFAGPYTFAISSRGIPFQVAYYSISCVAISRADGIFLKGSPIHSGPYLAGTTNVSHVSTFDANGTTVRFYSAECWNPAC
jgi:hypothetical protein